jgi:MFS family permease
MSQTASGPDIPPPAATQHATSVRWRILAVLLVFSWMSWFNRVSIAVAYDEHIRNELGISELAIGSVYSALLVAYLICMAPGGWFADRVGARLALTVMGLGSALFVAMTGVVGLVALPVTATIAAMLSVRAALGAFTAPIYPGSSRAIACWFPAGQRAGANGAIMAAGALGIAACPHAFGALLDLFAWPNAFVLAGVVTALVALLWVWYARDQPAQHPRVNLGEIQWIRPDESNDAAHDVRSRPAVVADARPLLRDGPEVADAKAWRAILTNRSLILLTLSYAAVGYFEYLFFFWMHYYFDGVLKLGRYESRDYATILYLAMAAGIFLGGWLADYLTLAWGRRRGRAVVVVSGMLGGAGLLAGGLFASQPGWIVLWFALALAAVGSTEGPLWATAMDLGGRRGATAAGIFNTGGNAGGILAPLVTPLVSTAYGWPWGIGLGCLACLAGVSMWLWIDTETERG